MIYININELFDSYPERDMYERKKWSAYGIVDYRNLSKVKYHEVKLRKDFARSDNPYDFEYDELDTDDNKYYIFIIPVQLEDAEYVTLLVKIEESKYVRFYIDKKGNFTMDKADHTLFLRSFDELDRRIIRSFIYKFAFKIRAASRIKTQSDTDWIGFSAMRGFNKKDAPKRVPSARREFVETIYENAARSFV